MLHLFQFVLVRIQESCLRDSEIRQLFLESDNLCSAAISNQSVQVVGQRLLQFLAPLREFVFEKLNLSTESGRLFISVLTVSFFFQLQLDNPETSFCDCRLNFRSKRVLVDLFLDELVGYLRLLTQFRFCFFKSEDLCLDNRLLAPDFSKLPFQTAQWACWLLITFPLVRAQRVLPCLHDGHLAHVFTQTLHLALDGLAFSFE